MSVAVAKAEPPVRSTDKRLEASGAGLIPHDWIVAQLGELTDPKRPISYGIVQTGPVVINGVPCLRVVDIDNGRIDTENLITTTQSISASYKRTVLKSGDLVMPLRGKVGDVAIVGRELEGANLTRGLALIAATSKLDASYGKHFVSWNVTRTRLEQAMNGSALQEIPIATLRSFEIALPPTLAEQRAIAEALSDADALIEGLESLIAKKRAIKQGAMQDLLTGNRRLPGFEGEWEPKTLEQTMDCLDNLRVPLNEAQRAQKRGSIPYCGANGVLDYVNDYVIDDDIILMAEDGGYFDEYETRPIAYRMIGKCWVNNHAHILKAKSDQSQAFLFYSLVHKNILPFLASGTRAKLNKSEMWKIAVRIPDDQIEQTAIAAVLSDMDAEIEALDGKLAKARAVKQGMMQELLTGRVRLV